MKNITKNAALTDPSERRYARCAFTLAEVLITLGIIGVVAALTLPTLLSNYRAKTTMTKLKKFYTTMLQAQLLSINDNGEVDTWDWVKNGELSNNEIVLAWFNKYWGKYLNTFEVIDKKILKDNGELKDAGILVKFSDGSIANFSGFGGGYMHISFYTDIKALENPNDTTNTFLFGFSSSANAKRFGPYDIVHSVPTKDLEVLKHDPHTGCYTPNAILGHASCAKVLQMNGWEVPEDYPYKF